MRDNFEVLHRLGALEDARERVIIGLRNGIELVVVTARATDGETHEGARGCIELLVDDVHFHLHRVVFGKHLRAQGQEPGSGPALEGLGIGSGRGQQIAGELLLEKEIVRLVFVERLNHIVAITPRVAVDEIFVKAIGIGVSRNVQPVPSPALAVVRGVEQAVDDAGERIGLIVVEKRSDFFGGRRQAGQVESGAADEGSLVGSRSGLQSLGFKRG